VKRFCTLHPPLLLQRLRHDDTQAGNGGVQIFIYRVYHKISSSFHGIETCAPFLDTVLAEANVLLVTAAQMSNSELRDAASTTSTEYMPMKVSPAAVVSTTSVEVKPWLKVPHCYGQKVLVLQSMYTQCRPDRGLLEFIALSQICSKSVSLWGVPQTHTCGYQSKQS
jgi:hypothetical protein